MSKGELPVLIPSIQWSPAKLSPSKRNSDGNLQHILSAIQDIDRQRTLLLNKAQRRCQSTSSLSPKSRQFNKGKISPSRMNSQYDQSFKDYVMCSLCGNEIIRRDLKNHQERACLERMVECVHPGCHIMYQAKEIEAHEKNDCLHKCQNSRWLQKKLDKLEQVCCLACMEVISIGATAAHLSLECKKRFVSCPNSKYGCKEYEIPFDELQKHEKEHCIVPKRRQEMLQSSKTSNALIECDWCNQPVIKRHMLDHKEDECLMRERQCPNTHLGCREWVPVGKFEKHLKEECCITLERRALAEQALLKEAALPCRDCGQSIKIRHMNQHRSVQCVARFVPCANAIHGCKMMLKYRDRHIHEHVDVSPEARSAINFITRQSTIRINAGDDIKPPWTAEFWVWMYPKEEEIVFFMEEAWKWWLAWFSHLQSIRWQEKVDETIPKLKDWQEKKKDLQGRLKVALKTGNPSPDASAAFETEGTVIDEGISGCRSIIQESQARVKALLSDAAVIHKTIASEPERNAIAQVLLSHAQRVQQNWSNEMVEIYTNIEKWMERIKQSEGEEENPHAKLLMKRMQLLKAIEDRQQKEEKDLRERARFMKHAKKELARLDEKLAKCVDVPLALVQPVVGFHTLASSSKSGLHLMMNATGFPGLHHYDKCGKFQVDIPRGEWVHLAWVAETNQVSLYLNGKLGGVVHGVYPLPMDGIGSNERSFRGYIQVHYERDSEGMNPDDKEVRYWNESRRVEDLQRKMNDVLEPSAALKGYWTFEEGLGDYIDDHAGYVPRSPCFHTEWVHYTIQMMELLNDPPTPSYRQRYMCKIVVRRNYLANKHQKRYATATCSLGCGQQIELRSMERHQKVDCPERTVLCREPYCGHQVKLSDLVSHHATCELRLLRDKLASEYYRKHELVLCPFDCGNEIPRKTLSSHRRMECPNRLVLCDGCGRSYIEKNRKKHYELDCDDPHIIETKRMISRSRTRQEERIKTGTNRIRPSTTMDPF